MQKLIIGAALASLCGCATVVRGAKDTARFESDPAGATVTAESISKDKLGPFTCVTPCELELKRKREWNVEFTLDGYKPVTGTLVPKVTGGGVASGAGNIIAGGIIGIGVDAGTGANLDLRPNPMVAKLAPADSAEQSVIVAEPEKSKSKSGAKTSEGSDLDAQNNVASPQGADGDVEPAAMTEPSPAPPAESAPEELPELKMDPVDSGSQ